MTESYQDQLCLRIGVEPGSRYPTIQDARDAFTCFSQAEGLPTPALCASHDGSAVYATWRLAHEIELCDWQSLERDLAELATEIGACAGEAPSTATEAREYGTPPAAFWQALNEALQKKRADAEKYQVYVEPLASVALGIVALDIVAAKTGMSPAQLETVLDHGPTAAAVNKAVARMQYDGTAARLIARNRLELIASDPLTPAATLTNVVSLLDRLRTPKG